ncbi:uncharacterized protein LOC113765569 [Coffea eugenioides]|uniref:uncharacterized protein LOC113765569 n=1 Tax=Coffea eugenioides TaxID=49369 RepID=UPI000F60813E|nr:uncharacterized protein LOC113765569 [Coffea eugenioides]
MYLWSLQSSPNPLNSTISFLYRNPEIPKPRNAIPARDRVIDFGKYKGKMVGTLPSNYLKWVSKNLRARDFEEWAKLADEVLEDPVYKDRIEWEFAQKVLNGDVLSSKSVQLQQKSAVSGLVEISERFGWDNEDKLGWAKVDFRLLGTSKGGRIPRVSDSGPRVMKDGVLDILKPKAGENGPVKGRRKERRERLKLRRRKNGERNGIKVDDKGNFGNSSKNKLDGDGDQDQEEVDEDGRVDIIKTKNSSVFPGREAFLKKAANRRRF